MFKFSQATLLKIRKIKSDQALQALALSQRRLMACQDAIARNQGRLSELEDEMAAKLTGGIKARELLLLEDFHASLRFNGQALPVKFAQVFQSLEQSAVDQDAGIAMGDKVFGAGDGAGTAQAGQ
ncbi:MAG: hypothetical protein BWY87_01306 [Deltaproteobacteria bacterium ADurb.Bin510]|nr:MAG: hypothetical protein BWY87_01306 [Deltaproteobacteria bacterium ADurb.Bin510]